MPVYNYNGHVFWFSLAICVVTYSYKKIQNNDRFVDEQENNQEFKLLSDEMSPIRYLSIFRIPKDCHVAGQKKDRTTVLESKIVFYRRV